MDLTRERLLRAYPSTPQEVKNEIAYTLRTIQAQAKRPPQRYARRLSFATTLLIMILLIAVIAVAVGTRLGIFSFLDRVFGESHVLPKATELVQTNVASLETSHFILTAEEVLYDGGNLRVAYSITPKDIEGTITEGDLWNPESPLKKAAAADGISLLGGCDWFYIDGVEYVMTTSSFVDTVLDEESGVIYCYMDIQLASADIFPQGDFTVQLPLAGELRAKKTMDFTVKSLVAQRALPVLQTEAARITVLSAVLSPIRAYVKIRVEMNTDATPEQANAVFEDWSDAILVNAAGQEVSTMLESWPANIEEEKSADYMFIFLPVDLEEAYLAPIAIDDDGNWMGDMAQALRIR